jgi:two-component system OmpR family response regulator
MKVLLAEDDVRLARAVRRALQEEMHVVEISPDGRSALQDASIGEFDVIVLDVMLPELDGFEVCSRLRSAGINTPVLMLTARTAVQDRVRGLDAGADDYLVKPFANAELAARLRALHRRDTHGGQAIRDELRAGDLTLDVSRHRAIRSGVPIDLTVKEFQLLELFLRHPDQVLTRTQILDHVWEYDRDFSSTVVDAVVHHLRTKVDKGFSKRLLHTVRGVGYVLRP